MLKKHLKKIVSLVLVTMMAIGMSACMTMEKGFSQTN